MFSYIRGDDSSSLMQRLEHCFDSQLLTIQYRMPPELATLVSEFFYDSRLTSAPGLQTSANPMNVISVGAGTQEPERPGSTSWVNKMEAAEAFQTACELASDNPMQTVAVLCPYAAQVRWISRKVPKHHNMEVLTVDSSQGREWDHVVLTLVRTEVDGTFVKDPRRQCVSMSSAKCTMTVVGNPEAIAALPPM